MNNNGNNMIQGNSINGMMQMPFGQPNSGINMMPNNGIVPGMDMSQNNVMDPTVGMCVYKPKGGGTLISDIIKDDESIKSTGANRSHRQYGQNTNGYGYQEGNRLNGYYDPRTSMDPNYHYVQKDKKTGSQYSESTRGDSESDYSSIRQLANEVNNSLQALEKLENTKKRRKSTDTSNTTESENDDSDYEYYESERKISVSEKDNDTDYLKGLTEFLLLLTLYVIMSQNFVLSFASTYIHQLNPTDEGVISMSGIIIYGIIMVVLFMVVRKIVFSRM
jgi:hypothetical protein